MAELTAINGSRPRQRYPLEKAEMVLGRLAECDVIIASHMVSRRHARLIAMQNHYYIEDLHSSNGTFVNGERLMERLPLHNGDRILIGDAGFEFRDDNSSFQDNELLEHESCATVIFTPHGQDGGGVVRGTRSASPDKFRSRVGIDAEAKLSALLQLMQGLGKVLDIEQVLDNLLDGLLAIFAQADRGFIVMKDAQGELKSHRHKLRQGVSDTALPLSRVIIEQVMTGKQAVLSEDAGDDQRFDDSVSVLAYQIHSVLCAPLIDTEGSVFGALQIDSIDRKQRFNDQDLDVLVGMSAQASIAIQHAQLHEQSLNQQLLQRDLELAQRVQHSFLPQCKPVLEDYRFFDFYQSANAVGGDFYDYIPLPGGRLALIIADVVGHGVAASLLMVQLSAHVRYCLAAESDAEQAVRQLNDIFCRGDHNDRFITFILTVINPQKHQISIVNAGHMAPLIRRNNGEVESIGEAQKGIPLGIVADFAYQIATTDLAAGELLALYTDGISEAKNDLGVFYGEAPIMRIMQSNDADACQFGEKLIADVKSHCRQWPGDDDICLLAYSRDVGR